MKLFIPTNEELYSAARSANWRLVPLWLWLILAISWTLSGYCFLSWVPYEGAITPQEALNQSPDLASQINPNWRSLTINHGQVSEWPLGTKAQNPQGYRSASIGMITSITITLALGFCVVAIASKELPDNHKSNQKVVRR